jgi:NTP pyrophosphatase (non-canonical NTP hydrolase)
MTLEELQPKILAWAKARGIFESSDHKTQCLKTVSEVGELADNVAKGRDIRDDIGDVVVTLTLLAEMYETTLAECTELAYGEIEHRSGRMVNGTFVKDGDDA